MIVMEYDKNSFIEIFKKNVKREGSDALLAWLEKSDFFQAPASTNFHSNRAGGLCEHSLKVFERFIRLLEFEYGKNWQDKFSLESATLCALLHDVCKVNYYKEDCRNVKVDGQWIQKPYYSIDDTLPYGHGEKSVYIISGFIRLSREEAMAINWHMGGFDDRVRGGSYSLSNAYYKYPTALILHVADLETSYFDETKD